MGKSGISRILARRSSAVAIMLGGLLRRPHGSRQSLPQRASATERTARRAGVELTVSPTHPAGRAPDGGPRRSWRVSMNAFIVDLEDRPGSLAAVAEALAMKGISITSLAGLVGPRHRRRGDPDERRSGHARGARRRPEGRPRDRGRAARRSRTGPAPSPRSPAGSPTRASTWRPCCRPGCAAARSRSRSPRTRPPRRVRRSGAMAEPPARGWTIPRTRGGGHTVAPTRALPGGAAGHPSLPISRGGGRPGRSRAARPTRRRERAEQARPRARARRRRRTR